MKRFTAILAALTFLSLTTSSLYALTAQTKRTINPARIVQLSSSIRFLYKKVEQTNPSLQGRAKLEEVCTLLKHLGFQLPPLKEIPADVTKMELATSILTGQAPHRDIALAKARQQRYEMLASASKDIKVVPLGPLPPVSQEDEDRVTNSGRTINVLPVARLRFGNTARRENVSSIKAPEKKELRSKVREMIAARQEIAHNKDKVHRLLEKLSAEAKKQLKAHRSEGMTVNRLVITTWKGLGLPCPNFEESWHKLSTANLAQAIKSGLTKKQRVQMEDELDMFIGS